MTSFTVGDYLLKRLQEMGVNHLLACQATTTCNSLIASSATLK